MRVSAHRDDLWSLLYPHRISFSSSTHGYFLLERAALPLVTAVEHESGDVARAAAVAVANLCTDAACAAEAVDVGALGVLARASEHAFLPVRPASWHTACLCTQSHVVACPAVTGAPSGVSRPRQPRLQPRVRAAVGGRSRRRRRAAAPATCTSGRRCVRQQLHQQKQLVLLHCCGSPPPSAPMVSIVTPSLQSRAAGTRRWLWRASAATRPCAHRLLPPAPRSRLPRLGRATWRMCSSLAPRHVRSSGVCCVL